MNLVNKNPVRPLSLSSTNCVGANSDYTRLVVAATLASAVNRLGEPGRNRLCWPAHLRFEVVEIAAISKPRQTDRVVAPIERNLPVMSTKNSASKRFVILPGLIAIAMLSLAAGCAPTAEAPQGNAKNTNVAPETIPAGSATGKGQHPTDLPAAQPGGARAGSAHPLIERRRSFHAACCSVIPTKPWPV